MSRRRSRLGRGSKFAAALSPAWESRPLASDGRIRFERGSEARTRSASAAARPVEFARFLDRIYDRESFPAAFEVFGETPAEALHGFVETARRETRRAVY